MNIITNNTGLRIDGRHVLYDPFLREVQVLVLAHNQIIPGRCLHQLVQQLIAPLVFSDIVQVHEEAVWAGDLMHAHWSSYNDVPCLRSWILQPPAIVAPRDHHCDVKRPVASDVEICIMLLRCKRLASTQSRQSQSDLRNWHSPRYVSTRGILCWLLSAKRCMPMGARRTTVPRLGSCVMQQPEPAAPQKNDGICMLTNAGLLSSTKCCMPTMLWQCSTAWKLGRAITWTCTFPTEKELASQVASKVNGRQQESYAHTPGWMLCTAPVLPGRQIGTFCSDLCSEGVW